MIWMGNHSRLMELASPYYAIYHVSQSQALLRALQHGLAYCVVIDSAPADTDVPALAESIRAQWPGAGIVRITETSATGPTVGWPADFTLDRNCTVEELRACLAELTARVSEPSDYDALRDRTRHLEELLSGTLTVTGDLEVTSILGDLRQAGRTVVDADDVAILLVDIDNHDLHDALGLRIPAEYVRVCREHFRSLTPTDRLRYLGDEVLLRARTPEMPADSPRVAEADAVAATSYMRTPIMVDQRMVGFVALFAFRPGRFNGAHLELGRLFAAQIGAAIRNRELYVRLNRAEQYQEAISRVARLLVEDLKLEEVLDHIAHIAVELVSADGGAIFLLQPDHWLTVSAVAADPQHLVGNRVEPGAGQAGLVAETGQPSIVGDYKHWSHAIPEFRDDFPLDQDLLGVPLTYRGRVLGVLQILRPKALATPVDEALDGLMLLAPQAATAIAKAQLHETIDQERRQLKAVLGHTPAAVVMCSEDGTIRMLNPEAEHVLAVMHLTAEDVKGRRAPELAAELVPDIGLDALTVPCAVEVLMGSAREYLVHVAPITTAAGEIHGYVGVAQDVTQMRRMDRMKSNLNRILTHDLGNLLMLARNPLEMFDDPELSPEQRDQLRQMLINSMARMETLLKDVMDLDLLPSIDEHTVLPYRLEALACAAVERNHSAAVRNHIMLRYQERSRLPGALRGHEVLIMQAIDNLVTNAIKYTPAGGEITVTAGVDGEFGVVQVIDTGYGIRADQLERIFEPFVRLKDPRTASASGTGMGLNLVKTFVEAHGGYVTVESAPDQGSTFAIYLPLHPLEAVQVPTTALTRIDLSPLVGESTRR